MLSGKFRLNLHGSKRVMQALAVSSFWNPNNMSLTVDEINGIWPEANFIPK